MSLRILVDSGSDLDADLIRRYDIKVIPLRTYFGEEEFLDGITMSHEEFFERLTTDSNHPTTSQPSPIEFLKAFHEAADAGDDLLGIFISGKLSGTYQSARLAALECGYDRIHLIDSESVTLGTRMLVELACRLRDEGKTVTEIVDILNTEKKYIHVYAVLDTLTYLQKGGRISKTVAVAGNLLSIKPLVAVTNGEVLLAAKARGSKNGERMLTKLIQENGNIDFDKPYCVAYSGLSSAPLEAYIHDAQDFWQKPLSELTVCTIGSTIGAYVGPGAFGVMYFAKER
ncbi:MAG: DegV family protein [Lachnospiraceae bacterium]|nr:DegV family protein [Lachnospiraceae bacterium]